MFGLRKTACNVPRWGTTEAVDVYSGKKVGDVPLGNMLSSSKISNSTTPGQQTGSLNLGGPMVTAGGLVFTSAAMDPFLRAFDIETGKELWTYQLPAGGQATPITYTAAGKQYLVISAPGHAEL